jgi:hypothetical protein
MAKRTFKHESFKRSYREDYQRELNVPGMAEHIVKCFGMVFKNWRLFLPLMLIVAVMSFLTIGITDIFVGVATDVFIVLYFLIIWLVTIFLLRQILAGHKVSLRDGLYNAMAPLIATFVIFVVVAVQCIPIILVIVAYTAAVQTEFLTMPFYALLFLTFALLMILISGYFLSSSLIALIAVTAPGIYPVRALKAAADLVRGRRIKFILRVLALVMVLGVIWAVTILPLTALKVPSFVLTIVITLVSCFSGIYSTTYLYLFYRYMLDNEEK